MHNVPLHPDWTVLTLGTPEHSKRNTRPAMVISSLFERGTLLLTTLPFNRTGLVVDWFVNQACTTKSGKGTAHEKKNG